MKADIAGGESRSRRHGVSRRGFGIFRRDARGAAAIEFGVLVPVLALMVVSVTDIGLAIYRKMQVENAAQAGVEY
ncbi:TadE/TadG family type IV pilus assembly protein, partial [Bradyrhizobium erythrophlei]|uniref:TadE/TadG family type IV pilus assembly protein n=1 Tax=Bradyrhizobium erythrophlei TaxID=1437360 RepID=UPI0035E9A57B